MRSNNLSLCEMLAYLSALGSWLWVRCACLLAFGRRFVARGVWLLASGPWLLAPGSRCVARGFWLVARGAWLLAPGSWLVAPSAFDVILLLLLLL